jgi:predicted acylesterase/phospholipase RssA
MMAERKGRGQVNRKLKRAICLGAGGPAAGLHIGVLEGLRDRDIRFDQEEDVWALSCIGAWVGIIYNQAKKGEEVQETYNFFRDVFRDDKSYKSFPTNTIFATDWAGNADAMMNFLLEPKNYRNAFLPREIMRSFVNTMSVMSRRKRWRKFSEGDFNRWVLNDVLAVNPVVRFLTALAYKSEIDGLSRLYYPDSSFLKAIKFEVLKDPGKPFIYHNAWNLTKQKLQLFSNKPVASRDYMKITAQSLCSCSALPFIEQTVEIDGQKYCEGALVDTVNFKNLLEDHPDLDEIWISRLLDADQIHPPKDLTDSLANLCELFAASLGEDDVKLFKIHVEQENKWHGTIVEIHVSRDINFHWSHKNLDHSRRVGYRAAIEAVKRYEKEIGKKAKNELQIIGHLNREERKQVIRERRQQQDI